MFQSAPASPRLLLCAILKSTLLMARLNVTRRTFGQLQQARARCFAALLVLDLQHSGELLARAFGESALTICSAEAVISGRFCSKEMARARNEMTRNERQSRSSR